MKNPEDPRKTLNVRLFRKVQRAILKWPEHFDICEWGDGVDGPVLRYTPKKRQPDCGAVACIAGWTVALESPGGIPRCHGVRVTAGRLLGLTDGQSLELFLPEMSPMSTYGPASTPALAARRIDRFLAAMQKQAKAEK